MPPNSFQNFTNKSNFHFKISRLVTFEFKEAMKMRRYLCGIGEIAKKKKDWQNEGQMNRQVEIIWELKTEKLLTDQISKIIQSYKFSSLCSGSCSWFYS